MIESFSFTICCIIFIIGYIVIGIPIRIFYYSKDPRYKQYVTLAIIRLAIVDTLKNALLNAKIILPFGFIVDVIKLCLH